MIRGYASSPSVDTEIIPKVSNEIDISKNNNNILQEMPNMTPYLAQPENNTFSLIESHSRISMGGVETIPVMASTLMSPLSAYIFLTLLIIAVMWFVILRRTWNIGKKSGGRDKQDYLFELHHSILNILYKITISFFRT